MKKSQTAIVLDIDGCLADFNTPFVKLVAEKAELDPTELELKQWHWYRDYGIPQATVGKVYDAIIDEDPSFWLSLKVMPGAQALINDCLNLDMDIHFATARPGKLYGETYDWLQQFVRRPKLCMTEKKGLYCAAVDAKYFLDDKPANCQNILHIRGTETLPFLRDATYNRDVNHPYIRRIHNLSDITEVLEREQR